MGPATGRPDGSGWDPTAAPVKELLFPALEVCPVVAVAADESLSKVFSINCSINNNIKGAIKSLMLIPIPILLVLADGYMGEDVFDMDDSPFMAVITDMISLKEEMISDVEEVF